MTVLDTAARPGTAEFEANEAEHARLVADLRARLERVAGGGGESARERHVGRGKLLPRERVDRLCDPGAPFLELSPLAAEEMYDGDAPGAGIITGVGRVSGRARVVVANDATVKGGTYYPMTVKKHVRAQEIALQQPAALRLPGRLGRRVPAAPGRGLPRPRALRPDLLQPGDDGGPGDPADRGGARLLHRRRRLRAGDERRDRDRARPGHDLPRRPAAGEGGDRGGGDRRGARRRRPARPHVRGGRPPGRGRRPRAADRPLGGGDARRRARAAVGARGGARARGRPGDALRRGRRRTAGRPTTRAR